jgi:predicted dehydrogenase
VHWFRSEDELLGDAAVSAIAVEGFNYEGLDQATAAAAAGKHLWYDKPAGDDWDGYQRLVALIGEHKLYLQMGYMLRYQYGFQKVAEWARGGLLGNVYAIRAHMSTYVPLDRGAQSRRAISRHQGGQLFDLGGHVLDQVLWLLQDERPHRITSFLRNDDTPEYEAFADNTLGVFEFQNGMAMVEISALQPTPIQRRFEVHGTRGTAILDPMEAQTIIKLVRLEPAGGFEKGLNTLPSEATSRERSYELELEAFIPTVLAERAPDRPMEHEILVQETLLRATGRLPGDHHVIGGRYRHGDPH